MGVVLGEGHRRRERGEDRREGRILGGLEADLVVAYMFLADGMGEGLEEERNCRFEAFWLWCCG